MTDKQDYRPSWATDDDGGGPNSVWEALRNIGKSLLEFAGFALGFFVIAVIIAFVIGLFL